MPGLGWFVLLAPTECHHTLELFYGVPTKFILSRQCLGAFLKAQLTAGFGCKDGDSAEKLCEYESFFL